VRVEIYRTPYIFLHFLTLAVSALLYAAQHQKKACRLSGMIVKFAIELLTAYTRLAFGVTMILAAACVLLREIGGAF